MQLDELLRRNESRWNGLHPSVAAAGKELVKRAYARGVEIQITQGLRTMAEQARLYAQGRTAPGPKVTNAPPGSSWHNFGLAIDFALYKKGSTALLWDTRIDQDRDGAADWMEVAQEAKKLGFAWGGDWTSFKDYPHFEMTRGYSLAQLRNNPKLASWTSTYKPASQGGNKNLLSPGGNNDTAAVKALQLDLLELGYELPKFGADGDYGQETQDAVRALQKAAGLVVDGVAGPNVFAAIETAKKAAQAAAAAKPSPTHAKAVQWAIDNEISDGSNPRNEATREQVLALLYNFEAYLKSQEPDPKADPYPVHAAAVQWAKESGITDGSRPLDHATRQQALQFLYNDNKRKGTL
jgi:peptidoglycan LD-endopeptidase CwlK